MNCETRIYINNKLHKVIDNCIIDCNKGMKIEIDNSLYKVSMIGICSEYSSIRNRSKFMNNKIISKSMRIWLE